MDVRTGLGRRRLMVDKVEDGFRVRYPSGNELNLTIKKDGEGYRIYGNRHGDDVDLWADHSGGNWYVEGSVGYRDVRMAEHKYDSRSGRIEVFIS